MLGNPATDKKFDVNSRVPFAHCMAIIPDELYEVIWLTSLLVDFLVYTEIPICP